MKPFFQDLILHTHTINILPIIKVTCTPESTIIDSLSAEREVKFDAVTHVPIRGLDGVFGMTNLNKLDLLLKCPEYKDNSTITVLTHDYDGEVLPIGLNFRNEVGDYQNDYRFINKNIITEKLKKIVAAIEPVYEIQFEPQDASIQRLKLQAAVHTEEIVFTASVEDHNLIFSFGDKDTHAGSFIFEINVDHSLRNQWSWPIAPVLSILSLKGKKAIRISDYTGMLQIEVISGVATYTYSLPAYTK